MTLYECGKSVREQRILGHTISYKTFACVLDSPQDHTMGEALAQMQLYLTGIGVGITELNANHFTITGTDGNFYTVAHEFVTTKGTTNTAQPTNILRHIFGRLFTIDALYIDESNEIVDLIQYAVSDIKDATLRPVSNSFTKVVENNPDIIVDCFTQKYEHDYYFSNDVEIALKLMYPTRIINNFAALQNLITKYGWQVIKLFNQYGGLNQYLTVACGMQFNVTFTPDPTKLTKAKNPCELDDLNLYNEPPKLKIKLQ